MFQNGNELYFAKVRPEAKIPTKEDENAGYDIYPCFAEAVMPIAPLETVLVPTGVASAVSSGYYLQAEERGSTGSKGLKRSAGVIDSGYRGEIFIALTNCTDHYIVLSKEKELSASMLQFIRDKGSTKAPVVYPYDKAIAQLIIHEVPKMEEKEISYEDLKAIPSMRGTGALGSSGK